MGMGFGHNCLNLSVVCPLFTYALFTYEPSRQLRQPCRFQKALCAVIEPHYPKRGNGRPPVLLRFNC